CAPSAARHLNNNRQGGGEGRYRYAVAGLFNFPRQSDRNICAGRCVVETSWAARYSTGKFCTARPVHLNDEPTEPTMIRTLLATTALAALISTGAIAQDAAPAAPAPATETPADPA